MCHVQKQYAKIPTEHFDSQSKKRSRGASTADAADRGSEANPKRQCTDLIRWLQSTDADAQARFENVLASTTLLLFYI